MTRHTFRYAAGFAGQRFMFAAALATAPYLEAQAMDLAALKAGRLVLDGTVSGLSRSTSQPADGGGYMHGDLRASAFSFCAWAHQSAEARRDPART